MTAGLSRTEITRFPHAVLDVRLRFPATHTLPSWLQVRSVLANSPMQDQTE